MNYDVCISGGGMVGCVIALLLNKAIPSLKIALLDEHPIDAGQSVPAQPSFDGRSTAVSPSSVSVLKQLALWPNLEAYATAIESIHVSDRGLPGLSVFKRTDNNGDALGYVIENQALGVALAKALCASDIACLSPCKVEKLQFERQWATLTTDQGTLQCRLAIVADGADSHLRNHLGIANDCYPYDQHAIVANIVSEKVHSGRAFERFTAQGPMAVLPLGRSADSRLSTIVRTVDNEQVEESLAWSDEQFMAEFQSRFGFRLGYFRQVSARTAYPLKRVLAREQVRSRLALMGNAAHFLHPVAGQGFNLSLRDALCLVEHLQTAHLQGQDIGSLSILQRYVEQIRSDQVSTIGLSQALITFFKHTNPASILARTFGFWALENKPWVRRLFIRQLSGRGQREARPL